MIVKTENGRLKIEEESQYVKLRVGRGIKESIVYIPEGKMEFIIPVGENTSVYPPSAFDDVENCFLCSKPLAEELRAYRNLALNPLDLPGQRSYYPHAEANFVTRNSIRFEGRNAIDGFCDTEGHYGFPYQAWGGGDRDDLEFNLYFGRPVEIDKIVLYLRADYSKDNSGREHDTYWKDVTIGFSDGTSMMVHPIKSGKGQSFEFEPRVTEKIKLNRLVRDFGFSTRGFAALSQIEVWGRDIIVK